ncbi:MAG TPA: hypothetical protein VHN99_07895 [Deinococcales bacterium]|nr:hypothetical protein [Deinococcales bacterium]
MPVPIGSVPTLEIRLDGEAIDHEAFGLQAITTADSDDEAGSATLTFMADQLAASGEFYEGLPISIAYGWDGNTWTDTWDGVLESTDASFGQGESVTLNFYGPSFQLRDANNPFALKGTRRDAAERIIRRFGLTPDVRISGAVGSLAVPDGATAWEALQKLARASSAIVAERAARTVYLGPPDVQPFVAAFWYRDPPAGLTESVISFEPHWTRKRRLAKVTVIGVSARSGQRFEGTWEYTPPKAAAAPETPKASAKADALASTPEQDEQTHQAIVNGTFQAKTTKKTKGRKPGKAAAATHPDDRTGDVTLYLPVRSREEALARARAIGLRGETDSRTATLTVPLAPVTNGQTIRVLGERLGRYAGAYYVNRVERQHLEGLMTLDLTWKGG